MDFFGITTFLVVVWLLEDSIVYLELNQYMNHSQPWLLKFQWIQCFEESLHWPFWMTTFSQMTPFFVPILVQVFLEVHSNVYRPELFVWGGNFLPGEPTKVTLSSRFGATEYPCRNSRTAKVGYQSQKISARTPPGCSFCVFVPRTLWANLLSPTLQASYHWCSHQAKGIAFATAPYPHKWTARWDLNPDTLQRRNSRCPLSHAVLKSWIED